MIKRRDSYTIGLDISINGPAIVIIDNKKQIVDFLKLTYLPRSKAYNVKTKNLEYKVKIASKNHRPLFFWKKAYDLLEEYLPNSILAIEGYDFNGNGRVFDIAEFTGYFKLQLLSLGFGIHYIIPPTNIKKSLTGFGHADKVSIEKNLESQYGIFFEGDDDLNDALAIALLVHDHKDISKFKQSA